MKNYINQFETELRLINYCDRTIACYKSILKHFLESHEQPPEFVTEQQIKSYLKQSSSTAQLKQRIGALKIFYRLVVRQPLKFKYIQYPRQERSLPEVLSQQEVKRLFAACTNQKHLAILFLFYSTGMREGELINLQITDIDSQRKLIRIAQGKGKKDRFVPLSDKTLTVLRAYFREFRPRTYLFNGQFSLKYSATSIRNMLKRYAQKAGITRRVYPHLMRHCSATHSYENGVPIEMIQKILGHKRQKTTMIYTQISNNLLSNIKTPDQDL